VVILACGSEETEICGGDGDEAVVIRWELAAEVLAHVLGQDEVLHGSVEKLYPVVYEPEQALRLLVDAGNGLLSAHGNALGRYGLNRTARRRAVAVKLSF
jgi:hypothetical protein